MRLPVIDGLWIWRGTAARSSHHPSRTYATAHPTPAFQPTKRGQHLLELGNLWRREYRSLLETYANDARVLRGRPTAGSHVPGHSPASLTIELSAAVAAYCPLSDIRANLTVTVRHIPGSEVVLQKSHSRFAGG
jgi:hypothetical protein